MRHHCHERLHGSSLGLSWKPARSGRPGPTGADSRTTSALRAASAATGRRSKGAAVHLEDRQGHLRDYVFMWGSSQSRSAFPMRLIASVVTKMARPGKAAIHHELSM